MTFRERLILILLKYEAILFGLITLYMLSEVFANSWLVTEDGPAHLYNSVILRSLFGNSDHLLKSVFSCNTLPVPNALDHYLLGSLSGLFSIEIADKIIHLLMVTGMIFGFRSLVRQISPARMYNSWLIFPFIYTSLFFIGFYNFYMGIALCFFSMAAWLRYVKSSLSPVRVFLLASLVTLLYFTHLILLLLFIFVVSLDILSRSFRDDRRESLVRAFKFAILLIPAAVLFSIYYSGRSEITGIIHWADKWQTAISFFSLHQLCSLTDRNAPIALVLALSLLAALIYSLFTFFKYHNRKSGERNSFFFWCCCFLILFLLLFIVPDDFGGSGAMTFRLTEITWLFLLLCIASGELHKHIVVALGIFSFVISVVLMSQQRPVISGMAYDARNVMELAKNIPEHRTGAYLPFTNNWLRLHLGELAFADRRSAMLSDYETIHDFFPIRMNRELDRNYQIGKLSSSELTYASCFWPEQPGKPAAEIDFLIVCLDRNDTASSYRRIRDSISTYYILRAEAYPFFLYESKGVR